MSLNCNLVTSYSCWYNFHFRILWSMANSIQIHTDELKGSQFFKLILPRVTIRAIFKGRTLARISILPKISRFWLFALCRSIIVWLYLMRAIREQSRRLLMLSNRSRGTSVSYNDQCAASSRTNEQTRARICIAFIVLTFLRATIGRLCTIPACYWSNYFGCFRQYKNPGQDVSRINPVWHIWPP